ncbi:MAG: gamma-glutamyl-gamma-aminobutyrate hydrolase family protein [Firmicutes bacterium]|nr:gamma-glutamyl-gamma-aminobutyrate hydrolase family protein [Bacillota bacterium]MBR6969607.1 gamma-glutamyl-gamma-aminobutyrate hydrolase family protein [Bacillota bacterium]
MKKPIIGVTMNHFLTGSGHEFDNVGFSRQEWTTGADDYANFVEKAGGIPILMPFYLDQKNIKDFVGLLDGLLITGGDDVGPYLYGEDLIKESALINYKRDTQEVALMKYVFEKTDIPVLGVCRGMQMINVHFGGKLEQDNRRFGFWHSTAPNSTCGDLAHHVYFEKDSRIRSIIGKSSLVVNSYHHQNVLPDFVGKGLKITGVAHDMEKGLPYDMPEVIELQSDRFVMGVQWHPEFIQQIPDQLKVYKALVDAAAK